MDGGSGHYRPRKANCQVPPITSLVTLAPVVTGFITGALHLTGEQVKPDPTTVHNYEQEFVQQKSLFRLDRNQWTDLVLHGPPPPSGKEDRLTPCQAEGPERVAKSLHVRSGNDCKGPP